jgi:trimethylamine--corrinoid protein Co-methyltransferase
LYRYHDFIKHVQGATMKIGKLEVLDEQELKTIHEHSLEVLADVGIKVELKKMRQLLADHGCEVDENEKRVKFKPDFAEQYIKKAPREFILCGADPNLQWPINPDTQIFGGLGTLINISDLETGEYRQTTLQDMTNHLILFEYLEHVVSNQMDIWPNDIPMHTIHVEAIRSWAKNCRKSFGMGAFGVMATRDMMEMMLLVAGGREAIKERHPFATIVSIHSPLAGIQAQLEGLMILAEYGQPALLSPEAMAGTTAPVTLAGLLVQHNAEVLSHVIMAQAVNPGTPVLYGTVSTVAEMKAGTTTLGAVETGLISAACTQLAHFYDIPCRAVAGATESKTFDIQCGVERVRSMMLTAMAGANYITCVGTTESTMAGGHELAVIDNDLIGAVKRARNGIEVTADTLGLDLIKKIGTGGTYITEEHTLNHFKQELYYSRIVDQDQREVWEKGGRKGMLERARAEARTILGKHQEKILDAGLLKELDDYVEMAAARSLDDFYAAEWEA